MLQEPLDLLLVIGGYNSSNTSHLAEMGERVLPTYFIKNVKEINGPQSIRHWNQHTQQLEKHPIGFQKVPFALASPRGHPPQQPD